MAPSVQPDDPPRLSITDSHRDGGNGWRVEASRTDRSRYAAFYAVAYRVATS